MSDPLIKLATAPDLVDRVYRSLLDAISDGSLAPGQRITQEDIAEQLAVSRQPVLQALRLLKKDGFIQDAPGRGVQVVPLDVRWVCKVYEVRGALDALAARLAAERRHRIDPALIARGRKAAKGPSIQAMLDADMAFHQAIYAAADNPLIGSITDQHWRHLRRVMGAVLQTSQRNTVWDEHEAIAQAIGAGEGRRAAELIEQHSREASHALAIRLNQVLASTSGDKP
ncbi:MAG TPA: GntR family transcriptional regulator [Burkholderiaceae bacterium]|nr:GntR family transcriptional regulator [Burkholderiaceae bacterium]